MRSNKSIFRQALEFEQNCPITQQPFQDPVVTMDGHTYQRKAILDWFKKQQTSPKTNLPLPSKQVIPNHAFKNMITTFIPRFLNHYQGQMTQKQKQIEQLKLKFQQQKKKYEKQIKQLKQINKNHQNLLTQILQINQQQQINKKNANKNEVQIQANKVAKQAKQAAFRKQKNQLQIPQYRQRKIQQVILKNQNGKKTIPLVRPPLKRKDNEKYKQQYEQQYYPQYQQQNMKSKNLYSQQKANQMQKIVNIRDSVTGQVKKIAFPAYKQPQKQYNNYLQQERNFSKKVKPSNSTQNKTISFQNESNKNLQKNNMNNKHLTQTQKQLIYKDFNPYEQYRNRQMQQAMLLTFGDENGKMKKNNNSKKLRVVSENIMQNPQKAYKEEKEIEDYSQWI